jgi:TolA-binding protein
MTQTRKLIGTSLFSLLLVTIGLFMVCSGRVQQVQTEDDLFGEENTDEAYREDLLKRLEVLEGEGETTGKQESAGVTVGENLASTQNDGATFANLENQPAAGANDAESFLTPELFNGMNKEINHLENALASKDRTLDSLRTELEETNYQTAALETTVKTKQMNSKALPLRANDAAMFNSDYGVAYQDALDDFYVRRFDNAIRKFHTTLQKGDKHQLADNCQYWIGECYFAQGNYYQAIAEFQKVYAFENSNKINDAQLMIGIAFMKAGEKELAWAELNALVSFDSNSESAKKAQRYLRMLEKA